MHGVAPQLCDQIDRPLLGRGAGGRSPGFLYGSIRARRGGRSSAAAFPESSHSALGTTLYSAAAFPESSHSALGTTLYSAQVTRFRAPLPDGAAKSTLPRFARAGSALFSAHSFPELFRAVHMRERGVGPRHVEGAQPSATSNTNSRSAGIAAARKARRWSTDNDRRRKARAIDGREPKGQVIHHAEKTRTPLRLHHTPLFTLNSAYRDLDNSCRAMRSLLSISRRRFTWCGLLRSAACSSPFASAVRPCAKSASTAPQRAAFQPRGSVLRSGLDSLGAQG
jgi:hypothetical protein